MASAEPERLVAVFGRNDATAAELRTAREFGAAIARAGATVLTGGIGTGAPQVKEQAIEGALDGAGRWVGVENAAVPAAPAAGRGGGLVLRPGIGHRRNFLGACLCAAAVVLPGEQGTSSELLFALALGRPVALVGRAPQSWDELRAEAQQRVPRPARARTSLDRAIAGAYDRPPNNVPVSVDLSAPADQVVSELLSGLGSTTDVDRLAALSDPARWDAMLRERAAVLLGG